MTLGIIKTMDELGLSIETRDEAWLKQPLRLVRIEINGGELVDLAREAELQLGADPEIAGGYAGLSASDAQLGGNGLREHLTGARGSSLASGPEEKTVLLVCGGCGEPGCWPLMARIETGSESVKWTNFEQPHRPEWDLSSVGPFEFSNIAYERALARLTAGRGS